MRSLYRKIIESFTKWNWKVRDEDSKFSNQCVDWVRWYAQDIGYPITTYGNAKWFATIWLGKNWKRVKEWQVWDIVIFPTGTYWHIAVVNKKVWSYLDVMEQNRDGKAYKNNNPKNLWSPVSIGKYNIKGNEVYFRPQ